MPFEDDSRDAAEQQARDEVLEFLLVEMGVPAPVAARDAVPLARLELTPGTRLQQLHPYSLGLLIERALQTAGVSRLVLEVKATPAGSESGVEENRVQLTLHDVEYRLDATPKPREAPAPKADKTSE